MSSKRRDSKGRILRNGEIQMKNGRYRYKYVNTFGEEKVTDQGFAFMGSEDFAFMLEKKPGNYVMLGNGDGYMLHHPKYQFNQNLLPIGAAYWVALTESLLK